MRAVTFNEVRSSAVPSARSIWFGGRSQGVRAGRSGRTPAIALGSRAVIVAIKARRAAGCEGPPSTVSIFHMGASRHCPAECSARGPRLILGAEDADGLGPSLGIFVEMHVPWPPRGPPEKWWRAHRARARVSRPSRSQSRGHCES